MDPPLRVYDIAMFVQQCYDLLPMKEEFIQFALCGLLNDGRSAVLDPLLNRLTNPGDLHYTRDYDSLLGIASDIHVRAALTLYVVGKTEDVLRKNVHITYSWGTNTVPIHKIPNICLGKWTIHSLLRVLIPGLYNETGNNSLSKEDLTTFYEKGLYPAVRFLMGHRSEWPATVDAELFRARGVNGRLALQTKEFPEHLVPRLGDRIRYELALNEVPWGNGIVFLHQIRGTKNSTTHSLAPHAAEIGFRRFLDDCKLDYDDVMDLGLWWIDVGLQVSSRASDCLAWRTDAHPHIVKNVLGLSEVQADKVTRVSSSKYTRDMTAHMPGLSGCRITPGARSAGNMKARYFQLYLTDKAATARKDQFHHAKFLTGKDVLDKKAVDYITALYDLYSTSSQVMQSNARAEVRISIEHFAKPFMTVDGDLFERSLVSVTKNSWWGLKAFRALAFQYVLDKMEQAPTRFRYRNEALLLAASAPWFLNSLHSTPDLGPSSRDLLSAILPHINRVGADLDVLPFLVSTRERPAHSGSESDPDSQSGESDDSDAPRNVPPRADTVPAIIRGLVFLREIRNGPDYPCPRFRGYPLTIKDQTFKFIFGKDRADVEATMYSNDMVLPANPDRVKNKTRRTAAYIPADDDEAIFHLQGQGYELVNPPNDVPSDDEDHDEDHDNRLLNDNLPKNIDNELTTIWKQFLLDLTAKAPNIGSAGQSSYCILPPPQQLEVDETTYQNKCLSAYFIRCQWKIGTHEEFQNAFNHLWPAKGNIKYGAQNYGSCRYYIAWGQFLDLVPEKATQERIRRELKRRFDKFFWVPHARSDRIWWTKWDKSKPDLYTPTSGQQACPRILVRSTPEWQGN